MKNWKLNRVNQLTFEKSGLIPRSITKTFAKFRKELSPHTDSRIVEEFKVSRYQTFASLKYLSILILAPILIHFFSKWIIFGPLVDCFWIKDNPSIFLNVSQEERAFAELQRFEERIHFEILLGKNSTASNELIEKQVKIKAVEIAEYYSRESLNAIKNILADCFSVACFTSLILTGKKQISVLKSFLNELIYGLSDTAKAFLIILFTDMFVGFHSPHGWEVIIEVLLRHFGLPESRDFIFLYIATFPVILDTIFKYWIFRYLNRISPSAVATYHNMNE
nr:envelope membrane protein [Cavernulicola chilensis]